MPNQVSDFMNDLAVARGGLGGDADSNASYLRGRIAAVAWIPGFAIALFLGGWTGSWVVGLAVLALTLLCMVLIAMGPRRVASAVRRRIARRA